MQLNQPKQRNLPTLQNLLKLLPLLRLQLPVLHLPLLPQKLPSQTKATPPG